MEKNKPKSEVEILKEILGKYNISVEKFHLYKDRNEIKNLWTDEIIENEISKIYLQKEGVDSKTLESIQQYIKVKTNWYLLQDDKIKALFIGKEKLGRADLSELSNLSDLQELHIQYCDVQELKLTGLPKLKELDISNNESLEYIELSELKELQKIDLRDNNIKELKLRDFPELLELNLMYNKNLKQINLSNLPKLSKLESKLLSNIEKLQINNLQSITEFYFNSKFKLAQVEISNMSELRRLDLSYCDIEELVLSKLPNLTELFLEGNKNLQTVILPEEIKYKVEVSGFDISKIQWK